MKLFYNDNRIKIRDIKRLQRDRFIDVKSSFSYLPHHSHPLKQIVYSCLLGFSLTRIIKN